MELVTPGMGLLVWQVISLSVFILPIICLVSIFKNDFKNNDKLIWVIVVVFIPLIGSILYFLIGRKKRLLNRK
jgi:hypothetical protein